MCPGGATAPLLQPGCAWPGSWEGRAGAGGWRHRAEPSPWTTSSPPFPPRVPPAPPGSVPPRVTRGNPLDTQAGREQRIHRRVCCSLPKALLFSSSGGIKLLLLSLGIKSLEMVAGRSAVPGREGSGRSGHTPLPQGEERSRLPPHRHRHLGGRGGEGSWSGLCCISTRTLNPPKITHTGTALLCGRCPLLMAPGQGTGGSAVPGAGAAQQRFPGTHGQPGETGRARCQQTRCCLFTQPRCGAEWQRNPRRLWFPHWVPLRNANSFFCCLFSPHAKRSSGITAPRSDSVGAAGQGKSPGGTGWDGQRCGSGQHTLPRGEERSWG